MKRFLASLVVLVLVFGIGCSGGKGGTDQTQNNNQSGTGGVFGDETPSGNTTTDTTTETDTTAPTISLVCPSSLVNVATVNIETITNETPTSFFCKLDGNAEAACNSPIILAGLQDGSHTVTVYGKDTAGNKSETKNCSWTVDTTIPIASITSCPQGISNQTSGKISFVSNETDSLFYCKWQSDEYKPCTSEFEYSGVSDGEQAFKVYAVDKANNSSVEKECKWSVDTERPVISMSCPSGFFPNSPSVPVSSQYANVSFQISEQSSYKCRLDIDLNGNRDTNEFTEGCGEWMKLGVEKEGDYTLKVTATDVAGNESAAVCVWTVDRTPPAKPVLAGSSGWRKVEVNVTNKADIDKNFDYFQVGVTKGPFCTSSPEAGGTFRGDGVAFNYSGEPVVVTDKEIVTKKAALYNGVPYTVCMRAFDKAGNVGNWGDIGNLVPVSNWYNPVTAPDAYQVGIKFQNKMPHFSVDSVALGGDLYLGYAETGISASVGILDKFVPKMIKIPGGHNTNQFSEEALPADAFYGLSSDAGGEKQYSRMNNISSIKTSDGRIHLFYVFHEKETYKYKYRHLWKNVGDTEWNQDIVVDPKVDDGTAKQIVATPDGNDIWTAFYGRNGYVKVSKGTVSGDQYTWSAPIIANPVADAATNTYFTLTGYLPMPSISVVKNPADGKMAAVVVTYTCINTPNHFYPQCMSNGRLYYAACDNSSSCLEQKSWVSKDVPVPNNENVDWGKIAFDKSGCYHLLYRLNDGSLKYTTNNYDASGCATSPYFPKEITSADNKSNGLGEMVIDENNMAHIVWYSADSLFYDLIYANLQKFETRFYTYPNLSATLMGKPTVMPVMEDGSIFACYARTNDVNSISCYADWNWPPPITE